MSKTVNTVVEIMKMIALGGFVLFMYHVLAASKYSSSYELVMIGRSFLFMIASLVLGSIVLEILFSFFTPREGKKLGEWERIIENNVVRNFSYALSFFFTVLMLLFAIHASMDTILLVLKIGFIALTAVVNLTRAFYYEG